METATFGAGCFWGVQAAFDRVKGVTETLVGYAGGVLANPTYQDVCTGRTGHAEVVQVVFDPEQLAYEDLLKAFWECHDPTQTNRQGPDVGTQYRSVVFTHSDEQRETAHVLIAELGGDGPWNDPIITEVAPLDTFFPAEQYHDEYFRRSPEQPYCRVVIGPKVAKFRQRFAHRLSSER